MGPEERNARRWTIIASTTTVTMVLGLLIYRALFGISSTVAWVWLGTATVVTLIAWRFFMVFTDAMRAGR